MICNLPDWKIMLVLLVAQIIVLSFEAWLGKTHKTKSGSIFELIYNILKSAITLKNKEEK